MRNAVLIACGRGKQSRPAAASALYTGQQFRLARRAAAALFADLYIVSGLHGIVPAGRILAPYDRTMSDDGHTPRPVDPSLVDEVNRHPLVVALLPLPYRRHADGAGVRMDLDAFAGCAGIGQQRAVAAALARGIVRVPAADPGQVGRAMLVQHRLTGQPDHGLLLTVLHDGWTGEHQRLTGPLLPHRFARQQVYLLPLDAHGERQMVSTAGALATVGAIAVPLRRAGNQAIAADDPLLACGDSTPPHSIERCLR